MVQNDVESTSEFGCWFNDLMLTMECWFEIVSMTVFGFCSCFSAGLCCTDLCRCSNCANTKDTEEKEDDNSVPQEKRDYAIA